uniref:GTP-binding regulatory protein Gi alpha-2 chain (Fragments) n=1 Tax=Sus scrofa domesticus TaxID=9825 RepID=Q7M3G8_PIG
KYDEAASYIQIAQSDYIPTQQDVLREYQLNDSAAYYLNDLER